MAISRRQPATGGVVRYRGNGVGLYRHRPLLGASSQSGRDIDDASLSGVAHHWTKSRLPETAWYITHGGCNQQPKLITLMRRKIYPADPAVIVKPALASMFTGGNPIRIMRPLAGSGYDLAYHHGRQTTDPDTLRLIAQL